MKDSKKVKPSYNCLKESLRCANQEAQGYLDEVIGLRKRVEPLEKKLAAAEAELINTNRIFWALLRALEASQAQNGQRGSAHDGA